MTEDLLTSDHKELDLLFDRVFECLDRADRDETYRSLDLFWARLAMHIRAEHLHLFPAIVQYGDASLRDVIEGLRADHDLFMKELAGAIKQLRAPVTEWDRDSLHERLTRVRNLLAVHNGVEEERIYPAPFLGDERHISDGLREAILKEISNMPLRFRGG